MKFNKDSQAGFTQHHFSWFKAHLPKYFNFASHPPKESKKIKSSAGFTLIELLMVISIISLLASIILVSTVSARKKARDTVRRQTLKTVATALEMYYEDNGSYPNSPSNYWSSSETGDCWTSSDNGGTFIPGLAPKYLASYPKDPLGGNASASEFFGHCTCWKRSFLYKSDGQDYKLLSMCNPETPVSSGDSMIDPFRDGGPNPGSNSNDPASCDSGPGKTDMVSGDGTGVYALGVYSSQRSRCW